MTSSLRRPASLLFLSTIGLLSVATLSACTGGSFKDEPPLADAPPAHAERAEGEGSTASTTDGGSGKNATPSPEVTCDASGCGGMVGAIRVFGFPTEEEAARVIAVLRALPPSMTRAATFDITRDDVDESACPDPTRTPLESLPSQCGYAAADLTGARTILRIRDDAMTRFPKRLDHVLTDFAAGDWFFAHQDEVIAMRYGKNVDVWKRNCYPCPADAQEECRAQKGDVNTEYLRTMRDFTASVAATLLDAKAWGGTGAVWKQTNGAACAVPERTAWIRSRLVDDGEPRVVAHGLDIEKLCGVGHASASYVLKAESGSTDVTLTTVGGASGAKIIPKVGPYSVTTSPTKKYFNMTGGLARITAYADRPFSLSFVSCE